MDCGMSKALDDALDRVTELSDYGIPLPVLPHSLADDR
jgi:hypothetical protein